MRDLTRCMVCRKPKHKVCRRHTETYRKQDGTYSPCPLPLCREHYYKHLRLAHRMEVHTGPTRVAHCGAWHKITEIPFTTPCCGAVLFEEVGT